MDIYDLRVHDKEDRLKVVITGDVIKAEVMDDPETRGGKYLQITTDTGYIIELIRPEMTKIKMALRDYNI